MVPTEGKHFIIEANYKGDIEDLKSRQKLKDIFEEILTKSNVKIFGFVDKDFNGDGVSGVFLLGESHLSYHTWPRENYVSIDFYVCGFSFSQESFLQGIYKYFLIGDMLIINRGVKSGKVFKIRRAGYY